METGQFNSDFSLSKMGIKGLKSVHYNLNEASLMQHAVVRQEGKLGVGGALLVETGKHTGRSPKDKYIVVDGDTEDIVWWEKKWEDDPQKFSNVA
jgi:phosphoenolpyruvate carboxykinase (ATP)